MPDKPATHEELENIEVAAAVFAKFAKCLNVQVDEYHAFMVIRDFLTSTGVGVENVEDMAQLILETFYDPNKDIMH